MFEWDEEKNAAKVAKHGVSFQTASRIFEGLVLTVEDRRSDYGEVRQISLGSVESFPILVVVHTERTGRTRIISARPANRMERARYAETLRSRTQS